MATLGGPDNTMRLLDRDAPDPALLRAWSGLASAAALPTQGPEFGTALAVTFLAEAPLAVAVVERAGEIEALALLCRDTGPFARWRLAGPRETSEPCDGLCRDAAAAGRLGAVLAGLRRPLAFDRIPAESALVPALQKALRGRGLVVVRPASPSPTLALDEGWSEPESQFNSGRRSDFRRAARKAAELGEVEYVLACPAPADFEARFAEAIAVEMGGWKQSAGTAIAADPVKEAFFRAYLGAECRAGNLRIGLMRIGGKAVAMQLGVVRAGRLWLYKIGYDESYRQCSPGTLLMLHTVGEAERSGFAAVEFLGAPEPWITALWTRADRPCLRVRTYPVTLAGLVALAGDALVWLRARLGGASR